MSSNGVQRTTAPPRPASDATSQGGRSTADVPQRTARLMRAATVASIGTAITLILVKLGAWLATGSIAVLSSLTDSLLDAAASLLNLFAIHHSLAPADREHRFGHAKAEPLSALAQSAFVAGSGALLVVQAISRLYAPEPLRNEAIGVGVMIVSTIVTVALVTFQNYVLRQTKSVAIGADTLHYTGDVLINGSVLVSLLLSAWFGWFVTDPLFGAAIAIYLMVTSYRIGRGALDLLMDRELPDAERQRIRQIVLANPEVRAVHDLRTRSDGRNTFIQVHVEMDPGITLMRAHEIGDAVEAALHQAFPHAEIMLHQDPAGLEEPRPRFV